MALLIITTILAVAIFAVTFVKMIKKNYSNYIYILVSEFIGIAIDFIFLILGKSPNAFGYAIIAMLSIVLPIVTFLLELKEIYLAEIVTISVIKLSKNKDASKLIKLCEKYPNSHAFHKMLAEYYENNNEKEKAEDEYLKAIELKPNDYKTYCKLATILNENNKNNEAIKVLQSLLREKPDYYQGSILLGNILYDSENFKEALNVYSQALQYNPTEYELYYLMGMTYTRLNDFKGAEEYYKKAASLNSIADPANLNLGQLYLLFKEYDEAEKYFYETIKSDDEEISAYSYFYLAKIRLIQGKTEQAIQYTNIAITTNPEIIKIIQKDDLFIPILTKIINQKIKEAKSKSQLNYRERNIIKYLGKTFNKVENLTNDAAVQKKELKEIEEDLELNK